MILVVEPTEEMIIIIIIIIIMPLRLKWKKKLLIILKMFLTNQENPKMKQKIRKNALFFNIILILF